MTWDACPYDVQLRFEAHAQVASRAVLRPLPLPGAAAGDQFKALRMRVACFAGGARVLNGVWTATADADASFLEVPAPDPSGQVKLAWPTVDLQALGLAVDLAEGALVEVVVDGVLLRRRRDPPLSDLDGFDEVSFRVQNALADVGVGTVEGLRRFVRAVGRLRLRELSLLRRLAGEP